MEKDLTNKLQNKIETMSKARQICIENLSFSTNRNNINSQEGGRNIKLAELDPASLPFKK